MENKSNKVGIKIFGSIMLIIFVCLTIYGLTSCLGNKNANNDTNEPTLFTRRATNNDISLDISEGLTEITYKIIPKVDIDNLELTFKYLDGNREDILTKTKKVGNVKNGLQYSVSVSLGEFSLGDFFKVKYTNTTVSNGTVSIFK